MIVSSGYICKNGVETYIEDIDINTSNIDTANIITSNDYLNTSNEIEPTAPSFIQV